MEAASAPGFYGKLSSHGDFLARRLPPAFVALWDGWLQACMQGSREQLGAAWLDAYLTGPVWRFALAPGVCDSQAWAGVLMPSVDRVGRHFPLALAGAAAAGLPLAQWLGEGAAWFDQLEDLALSTLEASFDFERFDAALAALDGLPAPPLQGAAGALGWYLALGGIGEAGNAAGAVASAALFGQSVWWTDGSDKVAPCVRLCRGLPSPPVFAAMLAG
ncbi:MAG: type VI secretion system-associated protein TagF [Massilia sp.]